MTDSEILKPFEREERYIVTKIKTGKRVNCVVIEYDWPEYEPVWELLQDRMEGKPNQLERDAATIAELQTINQTNAEVETLQNKRIKQLEYDIETWNIYAKEREVAIEKLRNESAQTRIMKDSPFTTGYNNNLSERVREIEALSNLQKRNNEEVKITLAQKDEEISILKMDIDLHEAALRQSESELSVTHASKSELVEALKDAEDKLRSALAIARRELYEQAASTNWKSFERKVEESLALIFPILSDSIEHTEKFLAEVRAKALEGVKQCIPAKKFVTENDGPTLTNIKEGWNAACDEMLENLRGVK